MTDFKYYRSPDSGNIYTFRTNASRAVPPEYEEVQVVPLDAIVIPREELPEVKVVGGNHVAASGGGDSYQIRLNSNPDWSWHRALNALAVSLYLREHPPVDEAQVKALAERIREVDVPMAGEWPQNWAMMAHSVDWGVVSADDYEDFEVLYQHTGQAY